MEFSQNSREVDSLLIDFPLIHSAYEIPLIIFAYMYFVLVCGPRFMKDRPPYSLKTFIQLYNIVQIVANAWLVYSFWEAGSIGRKLFCPYDDDYTKTSTVSTNAKCARIYFLLKLLDYIETVIFVLRKKNNQVSGLHVYHHVSTVIITWVLVKNYCITPVVFICIINSFVHMIMYIYYFLAACGTNIQKIIAPMKRWITIIQMVQFCFLSLYVSQNFLPHCKLLSYWIGIFFNQNILINFYLFYNFYKKTYMKPKIQ